jgi:hypothetical protein
MKHRLPVQGIPSATLQIIESAGWPGGAPDFLRFPALSAAISRTAARHRDV